MWPIKAIPALFSNAVNAVPWLLQNNSDGGRGFTEQRTFRAAKSKASRAQLQFLLNRSPSEGFDLVSSLIYCICLFLPLFFTPAFASPHAFPSSSMLIPVQRAGPHTESSGCFCLWTKPHLCQAPSPSVPYPLSNPLTPPPSLHPPPLVHPASQQAVL